MALSLLLKLRKYLAPCKFPCREACCTASLPRLLDVEGGAIAAPMDSFISGAGSLLPLLVGHMLKGLVFGRVVAPLLLSVDSLIGLVFEWLFHQADLLLVLGQVVAPPAPLA